MKATVEIPAVRTLELDLPEHTSGKQLKREVCHAFGIEPELTSLLLNGATIQDSDELSREALASHKITVDYVWARQLLLWGFEGQRTLRNATALVVGAGALGNETAKNLAMLGVGNLVIVDFDIVERSNLSRAVYFTASDIGRPKSVALAEAIQRAYPYTGVEAYVSRLEDLPHTVYLTSDIILSGLDNMVSRVFLSTIACKYGIPLVDGGMTGYHCRVQSYHPPDSPCLLCAIPAKSYGELAGLRNPCSAPIQENATPSLSTSISLVSSLQTQEALKILLKSAPGGTSVWKLGSPLPGVLVVDLTYNKFTLLPLSKNPRCIVCGKDGTAPQPIARHRLALADGRDVTTPLRRLIEERLKASFEDCDFFLDAPGGFKKINKESGFQDLGLDTGSYIHVICQGRGHDYKEALIEVVKGS